MMKLLILVSFLSLAGCSSTPVKPNDPFYAPVTSASLIPPTPKNGAIYQEGYGVQLWDDKRAKRIGDLITIVLQESTTSSKSSSTTIDKSSSADVDSPVFFGTNPSLQTKGLIPSSSSLTLENSWDAGREFEGQTGSDQQNRLQGSITVTVSEVLPNGLLVVKGEKWLTLSRGEEFLRISGLIRTEDINPDNTVLSTKVADARITYSGTGELADAEKMGWGSKILNSPWWPF